MVTCRCLLLAEALWDTFGDGLGTGFEVIHVLNLGDCAEYEVMLQPDRSGELDIVVLSFFHSVL